MVASRPHRRPLVSYFVYINHHARSSMSPSKLPIPEEDLDPHLIHGSLALHPNQHLYWFGLFAELTVMTNRHTDRHTD